MKQPIFRHSCRFFIYVGLLLLVAAGCDNKTASTQRTDNAPALSGTWILKSKIAPDGIESPVSQRFMKLTFHADGSFQAFYRGEEPQSWIRAGQGGFSYYPPHLNLYWESGPIHTLVVREFQPERLLIHHGRNMIPLKDQEPDEVFVKQKTEKGPTRGQS
jgi:hypothetical protein